MKKVLIFGVCGFVGNYLTEEFERHGYEVCGSDVNDTGTFSQSHTFFNADLLNESEVVKVIRNASPDMIVNLAAISSVGASWNIPQKTISVNVIGALNILEGAKTMESSPKVMFIGSSEEYEPSDGNISEETTLNANNPYGISKLAQERFAKLYRNRYGMKVYCVRPFNHTGIGQNDNFVLPSFCKQVAEIEKSGKEGIIRVGNLSAKRDFSDVRDIVRAYRMIIENDDCEKIYNVGSGQAWGLDELLDYIVSLSSQKIEIFVDPERFRPEDTPRICCDNSLIKKDLGWEPEHEIKDTLREMYEAFLAK